MKGVSTQIRAQNKLLAFTIQFRSCIFSALKTCSKFRFNKSPSVVSEYFEANVQRAIIATNTSGVWFRKSILVEQWMVRFRSSCLLYCLFQLTCEVDVFRWRLINEKNKSWLVSIMAVFQFFGKKINFGYFFLSLGLSWTWILCKPNEAVAVECSGMLAPRGLQFRRFFIVYR